MDTKQNSRRAWKLVKNLSNDPTKSSTILCNITSNQTAHLLLLNGKTTTKKKKMKIIRDLESENDMMKQPFTLAELNLAIKAMKTNKAAGVDDLRTEQIRNFGPLALQYILNLMNNCVQSLNIPKKMA